MFNKLIYAVFLFNCWFFKLIARKSYHIFSPFTSHRLNRLKNHFINPINCLHERKRWCAVVTRNQNGGFWWRQCFVVDETTFCSCARSAAPWNNIWDVDFMTSQQTNVGRINPNDWPVLGWLERHLLMWMDSLTAVTQIFTILATQKTKRRKRALVIVLLSSLVMNKLKLWRIIIIFSLCYLSSLFSSKRPSPGN